MIGEHIRRVEQEIKIIKQIFESQYSIFDYRVNNGQYVFISNEEGQFEVGGRFINSMGLYSNTVLFNMQGFKYEIEEMRLKAVIAPEIKQLLVKVKSVAIEMVNYFIENLKDKNEMIKENSKYLIGEERLLYRKRHEAVITVDNYSIGNILIGINGDPNNKYFYTAKNIDNAYLAGYCQDIIDFISWLIVEPKKDVGFEQYLKDASILQPVIDKYKGVGKTKKVMMMVFALYELKKMNKEIILFGPQELKESLHRTFGYIGTQQQIGTYLSHYEDIVLRIRFKKGIEAAKEIIINALPE